MAYGVKYTTSWYDTFGEGYRVDILYKSYAGASTELTAAKPAFVLETVDSGDFKFTEFVGHKGTLGLIATEIFRLSDLYSEDPDLVQVKFYRSNVLRFVGWVDPFESMEDFIDPPYTVKVGLSDGITRLKSKPFKDYTTNESLGGRLTLLQIITTCLQWTDAGLPFHTGVNTYQIGNPDEDSAPQGDIHDPLAQVLVDVALFREDGVSFSCYDILKQIAIAYNLSIFQDEGAWWLLNTFERTGAYHVRSYNAAGTRLLATLYDETVDFGRGKLLKPQANAIEGIDRPLNNFETYLQYTTTASLTLNGDFSEIDGDGKVIGWSGTATYERTGAGTSELPYAVEIAGEGGAGTTIFGQPDNQYLDGQEVSLTEGAYVDINLKTIGLGLDRAKIAIIGRDPITSAVRYLTRDGNWTPTPTTITIETVDSDAITSWAATEFSTRTPKTTNLTRVKIRLYRGFQKTTGALNPRIRYWDVKVTPSTTSELKTPIGALFVAVGNAKAQNSPPQVGALIGASPADFLFLSQTFQADGVQRANYFTGKGVTGNFDLLSIQVQQRALLYTKPYALYDGQTVGGFYSLKDTLIWTNNANKRLMILRYRFDYSARESTLYAVQIEDPALPYGSYATSLVYEGDKRIKINVTAGGGVGGVDATIINNQTSQAYLPNTGVVAGEYGSPTRVPVLTVDETGRVFVAEDHDLKENFHLQAGNAFGAPSRIGTTDSQPVQIITNNTSRVTVSETGNVAVTTGSLQVFDGLNARYYGKSAGTGNPITALLVGNGLGGSQTLELGGGTTQGEPVTALRFRSGTAGGLGAGTLLGQWNTASLTVNTLLQSTVADGTAPMQVASLTKVVNLNADLLDGQHGPFYQDAGNINAGTLNIARHPLSGVAAGTYRSVTVNASGHVTAASNPAELTPGTLNYVQKSTGTALADSQIFDNGTAVGVGTNSPQAFLDVRGPMWVRQADASYFSVDSTTSGGVKLDFNNTAKLGIGYNGGARIATFTNTGRTGFGTTDPQATVDVRGNMWVRNPSGASYFSVTPTSAGGVQLHAGNTGKLHLGYNDTTNILTVWGEGANRVGVNKETPSEALDVVGNVLSSGDIKAGAYLVSSQTLYSTPQTTGGRVAILDGDGNVKASRTIETIAATDAPATISGAWAFSTVPTTSGTPSASNHLVTVGFVNSLGLGVKRGLSVKTVATDNINTSGLQTVRGYTLQEGDRILRVGQAAAYGNGVWIASAGSWTRATDSDSDAELRNYYYTATEGASAGERWANTNASTITVDTTDLTYERDSSQETDPTVPAWVKAITSDQAANLAYMVRTNGSYANPAWLTSLAATKLTGADEILSLNNVAALSPTGVPFKQDGTWSITGGIPQSQTPALTAFLANINAGYVTRKGDGTFASRTYQAGTGIAITYPAGQEGNSVWSLAPTGVAPVTSGPYQFDGFGRLVAKRAIDFTTDIINIPEILGGSDKRPPTFAFSTLTAIAGSSFAFAVDVAAAKTSYHAMSDITITRITATSGAINFNYDPATKILALNGTIPGAGSFSVNIEAKDNLNNTGGGSLPIVVVPPGGGEEVLACSARVLLAELYGFSKVHDLSRRSARFGWSGPATGTIGSIRWKTFTAANSGGSQANVTVQAESYQSGSPEGNSTQYITLSSPTAHYTNYTVNVSQAGTFKLNFFHACADSTNSLKYQVNGGTIVTKTLTDTGGWDNFVTSSDSDITLNAGTNTIKLMGGGSSVKIDYFTLKYPAGGGGGVVRTLYDTGTVPGNGDRPVVDFNKEHVPGVNYIFEIQGETCTSTPDETSIVIPDDGYTLRAELWNNDGSGLNGKISDITPGGSYDLPEAGWELIMVVEGIQHNNYSTSLEKKQSDGSYQIRYGEGTVQVGSSKTSGAYELFGSGNNLTRAVPGSPLNEGIYRYTFSPYQGGLKQREYIIDFTLIKTVVEGTPSAAAYFYDDTNNAIKGQITSGQSFSLPTSWDVQYTTNHTDVSHIDMILNKTGVGQVFVNGSDLTPFAQTTSYLFNPGQLSDSSNLNFENPTPLREGSYTLQVALRKNNAVFRTDTYLFTITSGGGEMFTKSRMGFTNPGGDPNDGVALIQQNKTLGFNSLGTSFAYDFQVDADLLDANWPEYNHVTNSSAASSGSPHTFDALVHRAYLDDQEARVMIGLNQLWRDINGRNGITAYYGTDAMHLQPDGSPTCADNYPGTPGNPNDPPFPVPLTSCVSLSHPAIYPLALKKCRLFVKRYKPAIQQNIVPLFGIGIDPNAEAQGLFEVRNGFGVAIGQPKGDFNPYAIAEFKARYPQHEGADKNAIANASYSTALGSDWQYFECDKIRRFEWRLIADLIAEFPWLADKKFWMIDAGSHADGLSHIRRTFAVQSRLHPINGGFIKANDNPYKYYLFDYLWSAGRFGAITYEEITPMDGAINNNSKSLMVEYATRCRKLGIGLSWLTQGIALNGIFQQIAQEAGLYSISTRQMPDPADVRTCNLNLSAIIAGGTSYLEDQWTAAGGSETKFVQFIVNDDKALS